LVKWKLYILHRRRKYLWSSSVWYCLVCGYQLFILTTSSSLQIFVPTFLLHSYTVTSSLTKQALLRPLVSTTTPSPIHIHSLSSSFVFISFLFFYFMSFPLLLTFLPPITLHFLPLASTLIKESLKNCYFLLFALAMPKIFEL
jgi:hypothetical protein